MKKLDKLVLGAFLGPFLITFLVVVFILLNIQMIRYFDDIIGKGLEWTVVAQLFFHFGVVTTPTALPLAVLLSALIAYGNLGEHFELTAVKAAGVSLTRTIRPIFFFVLILTGLAFYANNYLVPKAALEAYSLLWDIRQKKPALDLREGTFYYGIPDISIKVDKKFEDGETLKDIIIYDHRDSDGNKNVYVADSGRMYTILNEQYLKLELYNGYNYTEGISSESEMIGQKKNVRSETLSRSSFEKTFVVFDLSSFKLERTDKKWFQSNRIMRNMEELDMDLDSINREILKLRLAYYGNRLSYFRYFNKDDTVILPPEVYVYKRWSDSVTQAKYRAQYQRQQDSAAARGVTIVEGDTLKAAKDTTRVASPAPSTSAAHRTAVAQNVRTRTTSRPAPPPAKKDEKKDTDTLSWEQKEKIIAKTIDSLVNAKPDQTVIQGATNMARQVKNLVGTSNSEVKRYDTELIIFRIQWHKIIASSLACIAMFLIGAPLGAIIKKGGLGIPFLVSVLFFIIFYVLTIQGEKFAKRGDIGVITGVWMPDAVFLIIGLIFLRQARRDARLFDMDIYHIMVDRIKTAWRTRRERRLAIKSVAK
ncbi:MAG: LptF/LptG family permease [Bacteroidota bacterium]|jgi:lipopolysaccharide export system permease protein|nr:MAG: YjgP/YjgQ family permease [Bacteroidota bacterium]